MMNYREVKCSNRLPEKLKDSTLSATVFTIDEEGFYGADAYDYERKEWENHLIFKLHYDGSHIEYWLEPYELSIEEEIRNNEDVAQLFYTYKKTKRGSIDEFNYELSIIKAITNLLKG